MGGRSKDNALEDEQLMSKESGELETQLRILYERQSKLRRWIIGLSILVGILALALLGAVSHSTRQQWDLEPGKPTKAGEVYDISVFHELHCLRHIRTHTFTLQALIGEDDPQKIYDVLLKPTEDHVFHCFDYIRQALMCAGDMTIEWPRVEADGSRFAVDGWGITHECKSWDAIMQYMQENSVSNIF